MTESKYGGHSLEALEREPQILLQDAPRRDLIAAARRAEELDTTKADALNNFAANCQLENELRQRISELKRENAALREDKARSVEMLRNLGVIPEAEDADRGKEE